MNQPEKSTPIVIYWDKIESEMSPEERELEEAQETIVQLEKDLEEAMERIDYLESELKIWKI